ncbi:MAG: toll/interleukin-1 receptor domain-containing protein, partial [Chloroflexi bacterium]|nr:toll/interleukin-1 receptor domain-containing protein [Chloroflexota bacterium]
MDDIAYHDIFCIYHPDDIVFVRRLAAQMRASGIDCWFDDSDFGKLSAESAQLKAGLLQSYTVAIVLSQPSAESQLCNELIQHAVTHRKRIITLIRDDNISVEVHPAIISNTYLYFREQDNLVEQIEKLRPRLAVDGDLRLHTELLVAAERWRVSGRNHEHLLPADRWEEARRWLAGANKRQPKPSQLQVEFIHSSRRGRSSGLGKRTGSWARRLMLLLAALIVVALGAILLQGIAGAISARQADGIQTQAAQTQIALGDGSEGAIGLIDQLAATSARISESVGATASAATVAAIESRATGQARATIARATQAHLPMRHSDGRRLLDAAQQALQANDLELALALTWAAKAALDEPGSAHRLLRLIMADLERVKLDDGAELGDSTAAQILPDALLGSRIAAGSLLLVREDGIHMRPLDDGRADRKLPAGLWASAGNILALHDSETATIYADGEALRSWSAPLNTLQAVYPAADGSAMVAVDDRIMWLLHSESPEPRALGWGEAGLARAVVFAADGRRFLSLHDEVALLWNARDGSTLAAFPLGLATEAQAAFHADALVVFVLLDEGLATLTRLSLEDYSAQRQLLVDVRLGMLADDGASLALAKADGSIISFDTSDVG